MLNLVGDVVLNTRFRFGFMGYYNDDIGLSPFGRYFLGGDGLSSWVLDGREVVPLRGYENNSLVQYQRRRLRLRPFHHRAAPAAHRERQRHHLGTRIHRRW